jgi:autophagy-related protein 9
VSFISGSLATVLVVATLFEEELQQGFEVTSGRSALFYIGLFGTIMALAGSFIPIDNYVFEPDRWMKQVILDTHYNPADWKNKYHTEQV